MLYVSYAFGATLCNRNENENCDEGPGNVSVIRTSSMDPLPSIEHYDTGDEVGDYEVVSLEYEYINVE